MCCKHPPHLASVHAIQAATRHPASPGACCAVSCATETLWHTCVQPICRGNWPRPVQVKTYLLISDSHCGVAPHESQCHPKRPSQSSVQLSTCCNLSMSAADWVHKHTAHGGLRLAESEVQRPPSWWLDCLAARGSALLRVITNQHTSVPHTQLTKPQHLIRAQPFALGCAIGTLPCAQSRCEHTSQNHRIKPACYWTTITRHSHGQAGTKPSRLLVEKLHSSHRGRHPPEHHKHRQVHTLTQPETEALTESVNILLVSGL